MSFIDKQPGSGQRPAFGDALHVGRPNVGDRGALFARIEGMLDRGWLTNDGVLVREFEERVAGLAGVRHCIAMCNATIALEIAIRALGMSGEVIVPSFTFIATAHALQWQQITPVFCDVAPGSHHIDPQRVEELITPRTSGIIGVHTWGDACDTDALERIAGRHGLPLLFDAAHAFGCTHLGRPIGGFGSAEVFSFHATKFVNALEGGAIVTNDGALAEKVRLMRNFGFAGYDNVVYIGTNGKMSEASAAMGLTNLDALEMFLDVNRRNYRAYEEGLHGLPGVKLRPYSLNERRNYQYVVLEVDEGQAGLSRDMLQELLRAENVLARRYFYPGCHRMEPYRSYFPHAHLLLPETESLVQRVLLLPTGTAVGVRDVELVCEILRGAIMNASRTTVRLAGRGTEPGDCA